MTVKRWRPENTTMSVLDDRELEIVAAVAERVVSRLLLGGMGSCKALNALHDWREVRTAVAGERGYRRDAA